MQEILDGHIHIMSDRAPDPCGLLAAMGGAGIGGGMIISAPPASFSFHTSLTATDERLDNLMAWCATESLWPCYWIDPLESDAIAQVATAARRGVAAFKVICNRFFPGDERALPVYRTIADSGKPVLFHSGILWDGAVSSRFNRPAEFEALLEIPGLVFSLAHISWPWCDELIAIYGKLLNAHQRRPGGAPEMYIDITPGTPPVYRRDVFARLLGSGYDPAGHIIFGTDCTVDPFDAAWSREWIARDTAIYDELKVPAESRAAIWGGNLRKFLRL